MQWAVGHNQGYPPAGFGGGFLFSQTVSIPVCPSCAQPITGTACWGTASVLFNLPLHIYRAMAKDLVRFQQATAYRNGHSVRHDLYPDRTNTIARLPTLVRDSLILFSP
jgi:hypothetical protein